MSDTPIICRICLSTDVKVYHYDKFKLKSYYEEFLRLNSYDTDRLPQYFCYECASLLHKFHKFKEKCLTGRRILQEMLWRDSISYDSVLKINRQLLQLSSPLQICSDTNILTYIFNEFENIEDNKDNIEKVIVDKIEDNTDNELDFNYDFTTDYDKDFTDVKSEDEKGKKEEIKRLRIYNNVNWKLVSMSEDEAIKAFHARGSDKKYLAAPFKCKDCFKGFSKEEMMKRHRQLRHNTSKGKLECRFCRMNFKFGCHVRRHMRDHLNTYECLRCHLVFMSESSALHHEGSHTGNIKTCTLCGEEFKHPSTYYSHLRTHRSQHICTICGSSFVSEIGLQQHKRVKHWAGHTESPEDDESANTFCAKCNKHFETRMAFEEHLFHSAMHTDSQQNDAENKTEVGSTRKILGKKMQAKITSQLKNRKPDEIKFKPMKRRWRRMRKQFRKPTTCHQCGKYFDSQMACMKHHLEEHPRTSFYAPNERHICEICGASLAPGSVPTHQNMHTKEKVHSCETCGRQFVSNVGLKRHKLTHTGEKPYQCTLCDKRFTQSNSMKLHYKTFHLKQPYPKRNRKKKEKDVIMETASEESDATKEVDQPGVEPVTEALYGYIP
ncbi:zinc finger protein 433-like [Pieris napi]|uniref:zinc finger protein 433-like n=1 Tax=Pieris napi TaxID=78633 RepID=UPI001FBB604E|nr:zinc finger protein 433-like [Pieris napi]